MPFHQAALSGHAPSTGGTGIVQSMKAQLSGIWDEIRHSYWFIPSLMLLSSMVLSFVMLEIDQHVEAEQLAAKQLYTGSPEGARQLLSTIAGSMMTVAGVVFSITIVALTLASNQFGPRLLRNFMRDTGNQAVLGIFLATFAYCLLILRQVHGEMAAESSFIPQYSILTAVILSFISLGFLIFFIHHVAQQIQATQVTAALAADFRQALAGMFPNVSSKREQTVQNEQNELKEKLPPSFDRDCTQICAGKAGYIQIIEASELLDEAERKDLIVVIDRRPGQFLLPDHPVMRAWPASRVDDRTRKALCRSFTLAQQRTLRQDIEYPVDQLVEIALLSLSPGINNTFAAVMCIERLAEALTEYLKIPVPASYYPGKSGKLRLVVHPFPFSKLLDAAFSQIRAKASAHLAVMLSLLKAFRWIAPFIPDREAAATLQHHAEAVLQAAPGNLQEYERHKLRERVRWVLDSLPQDLKKS